MKAWQEIHAQSMEISLSSKQKVRLINREEITKNGFFYVILRQITPNSKKQ